MRALGTEWVRCTTTTWMQSRSGDDISPDDVELASRRIEDIFVVLWGATQVNAVRRSPGYRSLAGPPYKLLRDSMSGWVRFWMGPVEGATLR